MERLGFDPRNAPVSAPFPLPRSKLKMGIGPLKFAQRPVHNLLNNLLCLSFSSSLPSSLSCLFSSLTLFLFRFRVPFTNCASHPSFCILSHPDCRCKISYRKKNVEALPFTYLLYKCALVHFTVPCEIVVQSNRLIFPRFAKCYPEIPRLFTSHRETAVAPFLENNRTRYSKCLENSILNLILIQSRDICVLVAP